MKIYLLLLLIPTVSAEVYISEFMPNPSDYKDKSEWFRLTSTENIELNNWIVDTKGQQDTFSTQSSDCFILTKDKEVYESLWNQSCLVIEVNIGLSNSGDVIKIGNSTHWLDEINYSSASQDEIIYRNLTKDPIPKPIPRDIEYEVITFIDYSTELQFGDFGIIRYDFNSSNYKEDRARFLVYGDSKRVICDLEGDSITSRQYYADTVFELTNISQDKLYSIGVPFFIKPNCNEYYNDGEYDIKLRIFQSPDWNTWKTESFTFDIDGINEDLCPEPKIEYEYINQTIYETEECVCEPIEAEPKINYTYNTIAYSSSREKILNTTLLIFCALLVIITGLLLLTLSNKH